MRNVDRRKPQNGRESELSELSLESSQGQVSTGLLGADEKAVMAKMNSVPLQKKKISSTVKYSALLAIVAAVFFVIRWLTEEKPHVAAPTVSKNGTAHLQQHHVGNMAHLKNEKGDDKGNKKGNDNKPEKSKKDKKDKPEKSKRSKNAQPTPTDANAVRLIFVKDDVAFQGYCHGTFDLTAQKCDGTFKGSLMNGCDATKCKYPVKEFECETSISKDGCTGKYTQKISLFDKIHTFVTEHPYSIVEPVIPGEVKSSYSDSTLTDEFICRGGLLAASLSCYDAIANYKSLDEITNHTITGKAECKQTLEFADLSCTSGPFTVRECESQLDAPEGHCNGTYKFRECQNGGSVLGCNDRQEADKVIDCISGYWDGNTCTIPPLYIIVDDNHFYSGTCQGSYSENLLCQGIIQGKLIKCDEKVTPNTLCANEPLYTFYCNGKLTKEGCQGDMTFETSFRGQKFETKIMTFDSSSVNFEKTIDHGLTSFKFLRPDGENTIVDIKVLCTANYSDVTKACGRARYEASTYDGTFTRKMSFECNGTLDLNTLKCDSSNFVASDCNTKYPFTELPNCNGTFSGLKCVNGGDIESGCATYNVANERSECNGIWNGNSCRVRPVHIIINNNAYVTGTCDGTYTENDSCQGTMNAKVVICPPAVTSDTLCNGPTIDRFICVGRLTKYGCQGKYIGSTNLRDAKLRFETPDTSLTAINKVLNQTAVTLTYNGVNPEYKIKDYGWSDIHSKCESGYFDPEKKCSNAQLGGLQQFADKQTYIEVKCEGDLNMDTLVCSNKLLQIKRCDSEYGFDGNKCDGIYNETKCPEGGNISNCFGANPVPEVISCDGVFENGQCTAYVPPRLSILKLKDDKWLKGSCSNPIENNACTGVWEHGLIVICSGDPVINVADFEACKPVENANFEKCDGKTTDEGCRGEYSQTLEIKGTRMILKSIKTDNPDEIVYNFNEVLAPVHIVSDNHKVKASIDCQKGFSPSKLTCPEAVISYDQEDYDFKVSPLSIEIVASCKNGAMDLNDISCHSEFKFEQCVGRSHKLTDLTLKCLGNFRRASCPKGGSVLSSGCFEANELNVVSNCTHNYWDGQICGYDKPTDTSEIRITELPPTTVKDVKGKKVLIGEFEVESFTMISAHATEVRLRNNVIKSLSLQSGNKTENGSIENIKMMDIEYPLSFDEGHMDQIKFVNFTLDELRYEHFATNDKYRLIHIKFKEFHIKDTMFVDFDSKNSVIRTLKYGNEQAQDYGIDDLPISLAYGYVNIRNAEVYLPYISKDALKKYMLGPVTQHIELAVPKIVDIHVPNYNIRFRPLTDNKPSIYIEFPEFDIENLSVNLFMMQDVILTNNRLNANPSIVQETLQNYNQDVRLQDVPDMPTPAN